MNTIINSHGAIRVTRQALQRVMREVQNYKIGGTFYPSGERGEKLKEDLISRFGDGSLDFTDLMKTVVVARNEGCELCTLKSTYESAVEAGYHYVTKKTLLNYKDIWSEVVDIRKTIKRWELIKSKLEEKKNFLENKYPEHLNESQQNEINEVDGDIWGAQDSINKNKELIAKYLSSIENDGREETREGKAFAERMKNLGPCINMNYTALN